MANLYWKGPKVKKDEISKHIMNVASKHRPPGTYGVRFDEGDVELWIEVKDPHDESSRFWDIILDNQSKMLGWRVLIMKCPLGFLGGGIKEFYAYEPIDSCKSPLE